MTYTLSLLEQDYERLEESVFSHPEVEGAAFLLCGVSCTASEHRLLCRDVVPVRNEHYLLREYDKLSIDSGAYAAVAKRAHHERCSVIFVHSHPNGLLDFSEQDDEEEAKLHEFLGRRVPDRLHGALVLTDRSLIGRVWDGGFKPFCRVRIIGRRFDFVDQVTAGRDVLPPFFERQVRAFGPDVQRLLAMLHVGVIGAGGTGSAVLAQLARLGVGKLSVFDGDTLDETNVNRVYGTGTADAGRLKVDLAARNIGRMGLKTEVQTYPNYITELAAAKALRDCDVVFGCTDKEAPRAILTQIALRYYIPVLDMGAKIDSADGVIRDVSGRVTTLMPGEACLFCRGRISVDRITAESLTDERRAALAAEGYAPELDTPDPAVIPFTTMVASLAVSELLHRLTGYMGDERRSSEVIAFFDQSRFRTNREPAKDGCVCSLREYWGRGDSRDFLGMTWAS